MRTANDRQEGKGQHTVEAVIGTLLVVFARPGIGDIPYLLDGLEHLGIENLVTIDLVEAFHKGVVDRFAGLDEADFDSVLCTQG